MSVVVTIFAAIGLVVVIVYLIYYLYVYIKHRVEQKILSEQNPPGPYMQNSGIKCPDYWVNSGLDSNGNYKCHNSFNVSSVNPSTGSYAGKCNSSDMTFLKVKDGYTWESNNPNGLTSYTDKEKYDFLHSPADANTISRCDWINYCGPSSSIQGIWSGVNEICNSPAPVS
jgi:hypothetical protein